MANDIVNINVAETVETVAITVNPNLTTVNINRQVPVGVNGQDLQSVTDIGAITTNNLRANSFIKTGGTNIQYLMADGSTSLGTEGQTNLTTTQTSTNFTINSDKGTDATVPLGNGTLAGGTLNDYTSAEKTKLAGIAAGATAGIPYTGATSDVNLGEFGLLTGNLEFDNTPTNIPTAAGSLYYNDTDGTLDLKLKGGNVTLQIGQEQVVRVVNKTATNISLLEANYQAVRITGAQGQRMKVDLAQATNDVLSSETIGLVTETIANNAEGFVTTSGIVRGINTTGSLQGETWVDGDVLYLSPTTAGNVTKVKPTAPNHLIIIGYVIYSHVNNGTIFVKVDNGYELDELHNVYITSEANEDFLQYESATQLWKNKELTATLIRSKLGITTLSGTNTGDNATNSQYSGLDASKQNTLVNTVNIKSINGNSLLGSGDLVVGSLPQSANTMLANNTNASATPTEKTFLNLTNQTYSGTIVWSGGSAPTTSTQHTYSISQIGNLVTLTVNLSYGIAGAATLQSVAFELPSTAPTPALPVSVTTALDVINYGVGNITASKTLPTLNFPICALRLKSTSPNVYEVIVYRTTTGAWRYAYATIKYFV